VSNAFDPVLASLGETVAALIGRAALRPLIVALDGPVAAGKSTLARSLETTLDHRGLQTAVVSADGFLHGLAKLEADGLMASKGFPESFNRPAMISFLERIRGCEAPSAPVYAHDLYDISPSLRQSTDGARVVIFEGVNVLQPDLVPLYDLRLFLDAASAREVFIRRFVDTPFTPQRARALAPWKPEDGDLSAWAAAVWSAINGRNLVQHIAAGRDRADVVLHKDADHVLSLEG
jgi:type I pantothenate kinase